MCVTAQVRVGVHLCTCVYGSAHMRIHMRVQGCACTSACKWRHARCCLRVSVQRWPMWVCVHMCVQIWACTAMCRGMRLQCLHMGLCKGRVAQLDHKYAIGLNRTCSCTHVAVCTQECKGCACVCKGRLEMCAYRSLCLNMDVSFCTRVYMHVDVCVLMDVSKGVLAHVCTCLPVGVCRCVDTRACARTGVCACQCLLFHTRVRAQGCTSTAPEEFSGGGRTHTRLLESTGPGSTALQHCALHSSLQDGTEHRCVGVLGRGDEALHRTHAHTHSRPKRAFKHCSAQLPIRQEVPKGPSASTARIGCKGRDWLAQGLAGIPMEAAVSSA